MQREIKRSVIGVTRKLTKTTLIIFALGIFSFLFMLPRLTSAQFGLLDDGVSIVVGKGLLNTPLDAFRFQRSDGRFLPVYWLYLAILFKLVNYSPIGVVVANWFILFGTIVGIFLFLRWRGCSDLSSCLAGIFYTLSASSIENYYTLSKSEPIMVFFSIWGLCLIAFYKQTTSRLKKSLLYLLAGLSFILGFLSKEAMVVLFGISFAWLINSWIRKRRHPLSCDMNDGMNFESAGIFFLLILASFIIWILCRYYFLGGYSQIGYSANYQFSLNTITTQSWRWIGYFLRESLYLLPISCMIIFPSIRKKINKHFLVDIILWTSAWVLIYLPWKALDMYYTLPFNLGTSMAGAILFSASVERVIEKEIYGKKLQKYIICSGLIISLSFIIIGLINNVTQARVQLLIDRTNKAMIKYLSKLPLNSLIYMNTPPVEYIYETQIHLYEFHNRPDLAIKLLDYADQLKGLPNNYWVVNPVVNNMPLPSVRSSLQNEPGVKQWNQCFQAFTSNQKIGNKKYIERINWLDIGFNRFLPNLGLPDPLSNNMYNQVLINEKLDFGWEIYQINFNPNKRSGPGYFSEGIWWLQIHNGELVQVNYGLAGDFPLVGDFDGNAISDIGVYRSDTNEFYFDTNLDSIMDFSLSILDMEENDYPLVGDWDGDGVDTLGFFRRSDITWNLLSNNETGTTNSSFSIIGADPFATPLAGDWDGDGVDTFGLYLPDEGVFVYDNKINKDIGFSGRLNLPQSSSIVVADWYGFGIDTPAVVEHNQWTIFPTSLNCDYPNPLPVLTLDGVSGIPIGGIWDYLE